MFFRFRNIQTEKMHRIVLLTNHRAEISTKILINFQVAQDQPLSIDESTDVIVLPLSPEADSLPGPSSGSASPGSQTSVRAVEMITFEHQYKQSSTVWRPLDETPKRKTSTESGKNGLLMDLPDRRRRKRPAKKATSGKKNTSATKTVSFFFIKKGIV